MKKEKVLEVKKDNDKYVVLVNDISKYTNTSGVWVMEDIDRNILLEVAQTCDIYSELNYDLSWLTKDYKNEKKEHSYMARRMFPSGFSVSFEVLKCDLSRTIAKYRHISQTFNHICVYIIIDEQAQSSEKDIREDFEMRYAIDNAAIYWNAFGRQRRLARNYYEKRIMHNLKGQE
ncbi:hypothetical protein ACTQ6A_14115 [Lachnospiraceae bacterium LCP25S3_G4]